MTGVIQGEARGDGYRPISNSLWTWATVLGSFPSIEATRLLMAGARRLDSGHLQIERVRKGIEDMRPEGSVGFREDVHQIVGDAEAAVVALSKALNIAGSLSGRYGVQLTIPAVLVEQRPLLLRLRDHYEHIDERALGRVKNVASADAENAFEFPALFLDRKLTDGTDALDVDAEATGLCLAARGYLLGAWTELVAAARSTATP